jgi:hypothetical protein
MATWWRFAGITTHLPTAALASRSGYTNVDVPAGKSTIISQPKHNCPQWPITGQYLNPDPVFDWVCQAYPSVYYNFTNLLRLKRTGSTNTAPGPLSINYTWNYSDGTSSQTAVYGPVFNDWSPADGNPSLQLVYWAPGTNALVKMSADLSSWSTLTNIAIGTDGTAMTAAVDISAYTNACYFWAVESPP